MKILKKHFHNCRSSTGEFFEIRWTGAKINSVQRLVNIEGLRVYLKFQSLGHHDIEKNVEASILVSHIHSTSKYT